MRVLVLLATWMMLWVRVVAADPATGSAGSTGPRVGGVTVRDIFTPGDVLRLQIEIPREGMQKLRRHFWGGGESGRQRPEVLCTVREGGVVYTNVALHLKGAAGSFQPVDANPAMTLNFDKFARGQTFHGLDKISLNNSVQDPSLISEKICREMFLAAGVPAPRATHARVQLNGRELGQYGLYVLVEGYNKRFLKRHFRDPGGNLYDGGFVREITDGLDLNSGGDPKDRSDLRRLADAAMRGSGTNRIGRLRTVLDLDRFMKFMALEVMTGHWDGYVMNRNNYRVYHDPTTDRMVFMPHGLDQMFGVMRMAPDGPIVPPMEGLVARAILQTPEGYRRHLDTIGELMNTVFVPEKVTARVKEISARIRPVIAERNPQAAREHDRQVQALCQRIEIRAHSILEQLAASRNLPEFGQGGVARLEGGGWRMRREYGQAVLAEVAEGTGGRALHIDLTRGSGSASWRRTVMLEAGRYRFEGRMRTRGVVPDPGDRRAGAAVRVSQRPLPPKRLGDNDWMPVAYEFEVTDGIGSVELVCELRAGRGEAWFDVDAMRLVRR